MKEKGFTLIELLLAMTILSILVVIIFGGFRIGVRAWEKGDAQVEAIQRQRIVLDLFKRQMTSARKMIEIEKLRGGKQLFTGDEDFLQILTCFSISRNDKTEKLLAQYRIKRDEKEEKLLIRETDASMIGFLDKMDMDEEDGYHLMIDGADEIKFEYLDLKAEKDEKKWLPKWDPATQRKYPDAVRLSVRHAKAGYVYRVVGRLICN